MAISIPGNSLLILGYNYVTPGYTDLHAGLYFVYTAHL